MQGDEVIGRSSRPTMKEILNSLAVAASKISLDNQHRGHNDSSMVNEDEKEKGWERFFSSFELPHNRHLSRGK